MRLYYSQNMTDLEIRAVFTDAIRYYETPLHEYLFPPDLEDIVVKARQEAVTKAHQNQVHFTEEYNEYAYQITVEGVWGYGWTSAEAREDLHRNISRFIASDYWLSNWWG